MQKFSGLSFISRVILIFILLQAPLVMSQSEIKQNLLTEDNTRLVTDNVMGGVSTGEIKWSNQSQSQCLSLTGEVSTLNNGGFIQATVDIKSDDALNLTMEDGVRIKIIGNGHDYNIHLRTTNLWFPWQAYRSTFKTDHNWQTLNISFKDFMPYKTSTKLNPEKIKRIGIVAIGRDFEADICIAELGFYKNMH